MLVKHKIDIGNNLFPFGLLYSLLKKELAILR